MAEKDQTEVIRDHDLLVRLDEKMDMVSKTLSILVTSIDQRGQDIEALKTAKLLHEQETKQQEKEFEKLRGRISTVETTVETNKKEEDKNISLLINSSIIIWMGKHQKISVTGVIIFLIMLNFHDVIVPWLFGLFGYKVP